MAVGYDISASASESTSTQSAAGPATSGGVNLSNLTFSTGSQVGGGYFEAAKKGINWNMIALAGIAAFTAYLIFKKKV